MARMNTPIMGDAPDLAALLGTDTTHLRAFSSPEKLAEHVSAMGKGWHDSTWDVCAERRRFTQSESMAHAISMARNGWQAGAEQAARLRDKINASNPRGPRVVKFDVAGARAHVPRALAGNPAHMIRNDVTQLKRRPLVALVSDMCVSYDVPAECLINRAATIAAVVDSIEAAGFSCRVVSAAVSQSNSVTAAVACTVKDNAAPVDIARIAYGLGHPAMFRRLCFAAWSDHTRTKPLGGGLGYIQSIKPPRDGETYLLPSAENCCDAFRTETMAAEHGLKFMVDTLRRQGCPAFPATDDAAA